MNKMIVLLTILVFTLSVSTAQVQSDSTVTIEAESEAYPIYAIGGLGITGNHLGSIFPNTTETIIMDNSLYWGNLNFM